MSNHFMNHFEVISEREHKNTHKPVQSDQIGKPSNLVSCLTQRHTGQRCSLSREYPELQTRRSISQTDSQPQRPTIPARYQYTEYSRFTTILAWTTPSLRHTGNVRSGMGAYAGAARPRVHLATVLLRHTSGHRPGRRQTRYTRIPYP